MSCVPHKKDHSAYLKMCHYISSNTCGIHVTLDAKNNKKLLFFFFFFFLFYKRIQKLGVVGGGSSHPNGPTRKWSNKLAKWGWLKSLLFGQGVGSTTPDRPA
jgi:hypothetical protein